MKYKDNKNTLSIMSIDDYYDSINSQIGLFRQIGSTHCYQINPHFGKGCAERIILRNGMEINIWDLELVNDLQIVWQMKEKCLEIMHCAEGEARYGSCESPNEKHIKANEYGCWMNDGKQNWVHFAGGTKWESISVCYTERFIESFMEMAANKLEKEKVQLILEHYHKGNDSSYCHSPEIELAFYQISKCSQAGIARLLYLESKAMEIFSLFMQKELLLKEYKQYKIYLSKADRVKLDEAKRIIAEHMTNPLSINQLAQRIDLNTYKLKVGFKEMWGTTVFGYLREMRLEKARCLLSDTRSSVIDVAQEVGYSNPSHFSTAFRRKYGVTPHEYSHRYR